MVASSAARRDAQEELRNPETAGSSGQIDPAGALGR
jgi:hypothetical protein